MIQKGPNFRTTYTGRPSLTNGRDIIDPDGIWIGLSPDVVVSGTSGKDSEIARLKADNFELRNRLQRETASNELLREDIEVALSDLEVVREKLRKRLVR